MRRNNTRETLRAVIKLVRGFAIRVVYHACHGGCPRVQRLGRPRCRVVRSRIAHRA